MRWLKRALLFWALALPGFYFVGLPYLIGRLETKVRADTYADCQRQHAALQGATPDAATQARTDTFCHCLSDTLVFTQADLMDAVQKRPPAALTALVKSQVSTCAKARDQAMTQPAQTPMPVTTTDAQGREVIYFK